MLIAFCVKQVRRGVPLVISTIDREEKSHCTSLTLLIIMGYLPANGAGARVRRGGSFDMTDM